MKPLRFGAHGATARRRPLPTQRGKPSRIATGPRADIQNQRRCVWKQVDQPAVDDLGRYRLIATRYIGNILVVPANGVGHHPLDYSHPRSLKAERSTPGGAYHPLEPYRAPSFIATSLLPKGIRSGVPIAEFAWAHGDVAAAVSALRFRDLFFGAVD